MNITIIVPYYRNQAMLQTQLEIWPSLPAEYRFIVVDDGSPEPAAPIVQQHGYPLYGRIKVFRIQKDIPWNRGGARNLGAFTCETDWMLHVDIDHVLPPLAAQKLLQVNVNPMHWYRFDRFRVGKADFTRKKDAIPDDVEFGKIHPHVDSYLCTRTLYWLAGGYDEDYSGSLGGGNPFLKAMTEEAGAPKLLADPVCLYVYTTAAVRDASDVFLSRDKSRYSELNRRKARAKDMRGKNPLRFEWERVV